jgi:hypothetical protein
MTLDPLDYLDPTPCVQSEVIRLGTDGIESMSMFLGLLCELLRSRFSVLGVYVLEGYWTPLQ